MSKKLTLLLCFLSPFIYAVSVRAADEQRVAIEGAYLLLQNDGFQRVLSFDRDGNVSQISDQQTLIGFTVGQGAWKQTGANKVTARVIDFAFDLKSGARLGPSLIVYVLKFTDPVSGQFQSVSGSFSGKVFPVGENPLAPSKAPIQSFEIGFMGHRIK